MNKMKIVWPIICVCLVVLLGIAVPIAYQRGTEAESELEDANMALISGQEDLKLLQELRAGNVEKAIALQEALVWDAILPVYHFRKKLSYSYDKINEIESFLRAASQQFRGHPAVVAEPMTKAQALQIADAKATGEPTLTPQEAEEARRLFRIVHEADHSRHSDTRKLVLMYLDDTKGPNKFQEDTVANAPDPQK